MTAGVGDEEFGFYMQKSHKVVGRYGPEFQLYGRKPRRIRKKEAALLLEKQGIAPLESERALVRRLVTAE